MTAYVLLAHLTSQPAPAQEELAFASLIAKWISSQQNPNGGFSSTQFPDYCSISSRVHPTHGAVQGAQGDHHQCSNILVFFLQLEGHPVIERTELNTNHVLLYLEKLGRETLSFSFTVERDIPVQGLKPAQVKVYDYYETDEFATQEYSAPCTTEEVNQGND
ncbi:PREDICTED: alpha-2-macroglobulin-like [Corvus brachyrhynchos]|uniref:alpha-2-macroglobulin-like n=1 Tax=Corvus brachyrhynchos TaxID=85066 RepID=UPI000816639B|nr:PREDICTED: alpha-2-macroglobulin-like [Corvus brachyrhynchos]